MFGANTYVIRTARPGDAETLERLAALDSEAPIPAPALIGELDGEPAAALSLVDGRMVADPFRRTSNLAAHMRLRAAGIRAWERTPSLRERMLARVQVLRPLTA
jgi:hypothetical protein